MLESGCPVATTCGGCPLIGNAPAVTRAIHENRLRDAIRLHLGELSTNLPIQWVSCDQVGGYRRRVRLRVYDDARVGFFNAGKYAGCPVLTDRLRAVLEPLVAAANRYQAALATMQHIELREPDADGIASAYFVGKCHALPLPMPAIEQFDEWLEGLHWAVAGADRPVPRQRLWLPDVWHYVPIGSFLQVNEAINALLVTDLILGAKRRQASTFCDLYAGSGNFSLPLLANGLSGCAVELDPLACSAARAAARAQHLRHVHFEEQDAGEFAKLAIASGKSFDLVVVDPPRAGIRRDIEAMAAIARRHLVYCSCNLNTLARDLAQLCQAHFELESVTLYDMFPNTAHAEALVWLRAPGA